MNILEQEKLLSIKSEKELIKKVEKFRSGLLQLINELPNPDVKKLSIGSLIINFKSLTKVFTIRRRKSFWSPEMHDFRRQYKRIAIILNKVRLDEICQILDRIIKDGGYSSQTDKFVWSERFHPQVIENIKEIWNSIDLSSNKTLRKNSEFY